MKKKKGFILLLSLVVISVLFAIGLGVFGIVVKELMLSGTGRESQIAFYAADTGIECVLYWDVKERAISTTTPANITCAEQSVSAGGGFASSFILNLANGSCARVSVDKTNPGQTVVESRGYNTDCGSNVPRKVERGIRLTY